jgi:short-subunit dehydrogenase
MALKFYRNKVWVITGAGSGIGLEMCKFIAAQDGIVCAIDIDLAALDRLKLESQRDGWDLLAIEGNVCNVEQMNQAIQSIKSKFGRVDGWINNAGIQRIGAFSETSKESFAQVFDVNCTSLIHLTGQLVSLMEHQGHGSILNMASVAGHVPAPFMTAYVASKHAVVGFTKALNAELLLLKSPVMLAFASPGFVKTPIVKAGMQEGFPDWLAWMLSKPEDCAASILKKLARGDREIYPTWSGRAMRWSYGIAPDSTVGSSRALLADSFKDFLLARFRVPRI